MPDNALTEVRGDPHRAARQALSDAGVDYVVGGAYALQVELGVILREVKDLDLFVRPRDVEPVLAALRRAGYETALAFPHWPAWSGPATTSSTSSSARAMAWSRRRRLVPLRAA